MAKRDRVVVEGLDELVRNASKAADKELPKRIGQVNKENGKFIISHLHPRPTPVAVGEGAGSSVRPSATKKAVVLKAGGKHRQQLPEQQWGKNPVFSLSPPERPFILGTVQRNQDVIEQNWLDGIVEAMKPAFHDAE